MGRRFAPELPISSPENTPPSSALAGVKACWLSCRRAGDVSSIARRMRPAEPEECSGPVDVKRACGGAQLHHETIGSIR
jgi:hypothetical protein